MMTKVKPINLGYHVTDYDTVLSRELLSDDKVLFLSAQPYDWFPLEANRQRVAAPYYLRPGQAMENQHVVKFGAAPLDNKLFFSMETPAQAERRYMASVVHPDYCVSINT